MTREGIEYERLKERYFTWLETTEEPLNLKEYASQYEGIEIKESEESI